MSTQTMPMLNGSSIKYPEISDFSLTPNAILRFYYEIAERQEMLDFIMKLDHQDTWAIDYMEDSAKNISEIRVFHADLERLVIDYLPMLHKVPEEVIWVLAHLKSARCMYILKYVTDKNPEFLEVLENLAADETNPNLLTIKKRLSAFHKANLLSRIFAKVRLIRLVNLTGNSQT